MDNLKVQTLRGLPFWDSESYVILHWACGGGGIYEPTQSYRQDECVCVCPCVWMIFGFRGSATFIRLLRHPSCPPTPRRDIQGLALQDCFPPVWKWQPISVSIKSEVKGNYFKWGLLTLQDVWQMARSLVKSSSVFREESLDGQRAHSPSLLLSLPLSSFLPPSLPPIILSFSQIVFGHLLDPRPSVTQAAKSREGILDHSD